MAKSISRTRKSRGRPPTGALSVHLRVLPEQRKTIDEWIARHEPGLTRPEAIRRLVELGLTVRTAQRQRTDNGKPRPDTKQRARDLAGTAIDEMTDNTASRENQSNRKRRLISGPEEFQSARRDRDRK